MRTTLRRYYEGERLLVEFLLFPTRNGRVSLCSWTIQDFVLPRVRGSATTIDYFVRGTARRPAPEELPRYYYARANNITRSSRCM